MTVPDDVCDTCDRRVIESGDVYGIECAWDRDQVGQAGEFLDGLASGKGHQRDLLADALMRIEDFAASGTLLVPRELNELRDGLWEVKVGNLRLPFYYRLEAPCGQVRLTHGFIKGTRKTPRKEIDRGLAIAREDAKYDEVV